MKFSFLNKIFEKHTPAFGLDVSGSAIKMLQFQQAGKLSVKGYVDLALPKGVMQDDAIMDADTMAYVIEQGLEKPNFGRIDTRHCVASLPESKSFVRVIQMQKMSEAEVENAILFEAENYIPIPIDQVYLDWQQVGVRDDKLEVLIIASPKDHVDKYLQVLEKAHLIPVALEVESQSVTRTLIDSGSRETTLIVDLDAYRSNLVMIEKGRLEFTSSIPIAGNTFTDTIAHSLGVATAKAETIKKQIGIANTPEYPNIKTTLLPVLNNLSAEIKNILTFHSEHSDQKVTSLLLCGGSAKLKHLDEFLQPEFATNPELKVFVGNPWKNFPDIKTGTLSAEDALSFTTAIGLALRGL